MSQVKEASIFEKERKYRRAANMRPVWGKLGNPYMELNFWKLM